MKLMLIALTLMALTISHAEPAQCSSCGMTTCLNSAACFSGCACAKAISDPYGVCVPVR